jgi:archaellum component FlaF (FlaF/FlaG flagellin family)
MDAILQAVVDIGAIVLIFMLVWVGFLFVTAQGNPEKISSARSALIWTVIGGLILLGAEAISKVIEATVSSLAP